MSLNSSTEKIVTFVVAVIVVGSIAVAPVTAASSGDGLLDDDGDDGGLLTNTTDSLTDTVDSTTGGATEPVTDAVDSTVSTTEGTLNSGTGGGTDSVTDGGTDGATDPVTDTVDEVTETVSAGDLSPPTSADQLVSVTDGLPDGKLPVGALPTDTRLPLDGLPGGTAPVPLSPSGLAGQEYSTEDLPVDESAVLEPVDDALPTGDAAPLQPEDLPYGSEGTGLMNACALPVGQDDLPVEQVPFPVELPAGAGPELAVAIVLNTPPRPCDVYDPDNPSLDPTNPPTDPRATYENIRVTANSNVIHWIGESSGRLQKGGFAYDAIWGVRATQEEIGGAEQFSISDGNTEHYLGLDSQLNVNRTDRTIEGSFTPYVFGSELTPSISCDADEFGGLSLEKPMKGCTYSTGFGGVVGSAPELLLDMVRNPPSPEELPIGGGGGLPPIGSLPGNSGQIINL